MTIDSLSAKPAEPFDPEDADPRPFPESPLARSADRAICFGSLPDQVGYALRRAQVRIFQQFHEAIGELGLSPAVYSVMVLISANPGLKQAEIAAALGIKRTNIVVMIDQLENGALAERRQSDTDRRSHALFLTKQGEAVLAEAERRLAEHNRQLTEQIGPAETSQLIKLLTRLLDVTR